MTTFQQSELDKIAARLEEQTESVVQFHGLYCDCLGCTAAREREKMAIEFEVIEKQKVEHLLKTTRLPASEYEELRKSLLALETGSIIRVASQGPQETARVRAAVMKPFKNNGKRVVSAWDKSTKTLYLWTEKR